MNEQHAQTLRQIYYDPSHPAGHGGAQRLARAAGIPLKIVQEWLKSQASYTLHKPARRAGYKTRKYLTSGIDHQWQADLADMQLESKFNEGYKYILTVIDIFSRYAWAMPLKTKSPLHVKPAFVAIFKLGRKPIKIQTDQGLEFESKTMQDFWKLHKIHQFSVKSQFKAPLVERFNRTLKVKMWNYFTHANTRTWIKILPKLIAGYNRAEHQAIDMAPQDVTIEEEIPLWLRNESLIKKIPKRKIKIKIGDHVRINKVKRTFEKGYLPNWTEEVFTVVKVGRKEPIQIKVADYDGNEIEGSFYREEIQVVDKPDLYRIESIVQTRNVGGKKQYLVKWLGYPNHFNSWLDEDAIEKLN